MVVSLVSRAPLSSAVQLHMLNLSRDPPAHCSASCRGSRLIFRQLRSHSPLTVPAAIFVAPETVLTIVAVVVVFVEGGDERGCDGYGEEGEGEAVQLEGSTHGQRSSGRIPKGLG